VLVDVTTGVDGQNEAIERSGMLVGHGIELKRVRERGGVRCEIGHLRLQKLSTLKKSPARDGSCRSVFSQEGKSPVRGGTGNDRGKEKTA